MNPRFEREPLWYIEKHRRDHILTPFFLMVLAYHVLEAEEYSDLPDSVTFTSYGRVLGGTKANMRGWRPSPDGSEITIDVPSDIPFELMWFKEREWKQIQTKTLPVLADIVKSKMSALRAGRRQSSRPA